MDELIDELERDIRGKAEYISAIQRPHMLVSALKDLNNMVGNVELKNDVATQVDDLIDNLRNQDNSEPIMLHTLLYGGPGTGKCLGKDTPVMMYDGKIYAVQDIVQGDLLMGDDSKPRTVLSTTTGTEMMYRIKQKYGDDYVVNESHILSLKLSKNPVISDREDRSAYSVFWFEKEKSCSRSFSYKTSPKEEIKKIAENFSKMLPPRGTVIDIEIKDYIKRNKKWKSAYKGYKVGVDYPDLKLPIDPYVLGAWLGDGTSTKPQITSVDAEIIDHFRMIYPSLNIRVNKTGITYDIISYKENRKINPSSWNSFWTNIKELNLVDNKHIPDEYLFNSRKNRLEILAGLIDTDGYYDLRSNMFDIVQKNRVLSEDILQLARSLGFKATLSECEKSCKYKGEIKVGLYNRIYISGDVSTIPTKLLRKRARESEQYKDNLVYKIEVVPLEEDKYYGFEIDGNHRFLLGDFTVTHNTSVGKHLARIWYSLGYIGNNKQIKRNYKSSSDTKTKNNGWSDIIDGFMSDDMDKFQSSYAMLMILIALISIIIAILGYFWAMMKGTANFMYNTFGLKWALIIFVIFLIFLLIFFLVWTFTYYNGCNKCGRDKCICKEIQKYQKLKDILNKEEQDMNVSIRDDFAVDDGDLIEIVSSEDFIGQYVGWTEKKTEALLQKNKGKVLFIDEAYSLVDSSGNGGSFGEKALHIINRYMSEHPEELIIIMAGYENKIKNNLFAVQPGLVRRFMWSFDCKGYTIEELFDIWKLQLKPKTLADESRSLDVFRQNINFFPNYAGDTLRLVNFAKLEQKRDNRKRGASRADITTESSTMEAITPDQVERAVKVLARNTFQNKVPADNLSLTPEMLSMLQSLSRNTSNK